MESTIDSAVKTETPPDPTVGKSVDEVRDLYNAGKINFQKYEQSVSAHEQATPVEEGKIAEKPDAKKETPSKTELSEEEQYAKRYDTDGKRIKGLLEKDKHILVVKERARKAEERADVLSHEAAETKKKLDTLMAEVQNKPKEAVAKESTAAVVEAVKEGDLPEPPESPSKPRDVYDEASVKEWSEYDVKKADYDKKVNAFLRNRIAAIQGQTSKPDPEILKRLDEIEKRNKELEEFKNTSVQQIEAEKQKLQTQQLYSTMDDFVKDHKGEYSLGKSIAVADSEYQLFMDDVARAAGVRKIGNDKYDAERYSTVQKWFDKEPAVLKACEDNGVTFPFNDEEYEAYSEVCKIHELWNKLRTSDAESTVNDAWILMKHRSGQLDKEMTGQFVRGAKASAEVKNKRDSQFAKTIPASDGTKKLTAADMSIDEQVALRNEVMADPKILQTDPEKNRLYAELQSVMGIK